MKINNIDVLVTKVEVKQGKTNSYLIINFITLSDGCNFEVIDKDIEKIQTLQAMTKYKVNLDLSSNKYGLVLAIKDIVEKLGGI